MQNSLFKLFEHKCVLEVCVHIHPITLKNLKSGCSEIPTVAERAQRAANFRKRMPNK